MTLSEACILIVDDEPLLRMTFKAVLERAGATVREAAHGAEALVVLRLGEVDLMVTDRMMPVLDGPGLLRAALAEGIAVPAVCMGGLFAQESSDDLVTLSVVRTLLKPFPPGELLQVLTEALASLPPRR